MTCNLKIVKKIQVKAGEGYSKTTRCKGPVKPLLMFYGEPMPARIKWGLDKIADQNWKQPENPMNDDEKQPVQKGGGCDLLLIIGSSMD
jgi:NAD-dependent SIR2 family protein deacetylase